MASESTPSAEHLINGSNENAEGDPAANSSQLRARCDLLGIPWHDRPAKSEEGVAEMIDPEVAVRLRIVPLRLDGEHLVLAMIDPLDTEAADEVATLQEQNAALVEQAGAAERELEQARQASAEAEQRQTALAEALQKLGATRDQLVTFLDHTSADRHHALWFLTTTTGLRRAETLALRWTDIDLDHARLTIRQAADRLAAGPA